MRPTKLRNLLLLLVFLGQIHYLKAKVLDSPPDSTICLKYKEFDFLAQAAIDRKYLRKDTSNLYKIIRAKDTIIIHINSLLLGCEVASVARDSISASYKKAYLEEQSEKNSAEKKLSRFKNLSLILGSVSIALLAILAIVL